MNKKEFIKKLEEVTGLDNDKCITINDTLEHHFIVGKENKNRIIDDLREKLEISNDEAEKIYESAMSIIGTGIKDKLRHPFKSQD